MGVTTFGKVGGGVGVTGGGVVNTGMPRVGE